MQIIKSKYDSKELFELYNQVEEKVNYKLPRKLEKFSKLTLICSCIAAIIAMVFAGNFFDSNIVNISSNAEVPILAAIILALMIGPWAIYSMIAKHIIKSLSAKGEIFKNPLYDYWNYIGFIEEGEDLLKELQKYSNAELMVNDDELLIVQRNESTGNIEVKENYILNHLTCGVVVKEKFLSQDGKLDFSLCDDKLEEMLEKGTI